LLKSPTLDGIEEIITDISLAIGGIYLLIPKHCKTKNLKEDHGF
jgi:hypothetical protein